MKKKIFLILTGGLGNQMFQYAAANSLSLGETVFIETEIGKPRGLVGKEADFLDQFPQQNVVKVHCKFPRLSSKASGFVLRLGVAPRGLQKKKCIKSFILLLASIYFSFSLRSLIKVSINHGIGFSRVRANRFCNTLLIGYFQSYHWVDTRKFELILENYQEQQENYKLLTLLKMASTEFPLMIHIRRGDYVNEKNIGILSNDYYQAAIKILRNRTEINSVWIFTDSPLWVRTNMSFPEDLTIKFVEDSELTPGAILEVMRYGSSYIIANSSFSLWAAKFSYTPNPIVIAPFPWFSKLPDPELLVPAHWLRIPGFETNSPTSDLI